MRKCIALILCCLCSSLNASNSRAFFYSYNEAIQLRSISQRGYNLRSHHSFEFSNLIVVDVDCGVTQKGCPRYCKDSLFADLFCYFKCGQRTRQEATLVCGSGMGGVYFNGTGWPWTEALNEWQWEASGLRKMYGRRWLEDIQLLGLAKEHRIVAPQLKIVAAELFDKRALTIFDAVVGMAPGPENLFNQLAQQGHLHHSIVSTVWNFWLLKAKTKMNLPGRKVVTVGGLDMARCVDWGFVKSLSPNRWVFSINKVNFMGTETGEALGMFALNINAFAYIGSHIADKLIAGNVAKYYADSQLYMERFVAQMQCKNKRLPPTRIQVGDLELVFDESATFGQYTNQRKDEPAPASGECFLNVNVDHKSPHRTTNVWVFGQHFFREYCIALNYETLEIGFAKLRKLPFPAYTDSTAV